MRRGRARTANTTRQQPRRESRRGLVRNTCARPQRIRNERGGREKETKRFAWLSFPASPCSAALSVKRLGLRAGCFPDASGTTATARAGWQGGGGGCCPHDVYVVIAPGVARAEIAELLGWDTREWRLSSGSSACATTRRAVTRTCVRSGRAAPQRQGLKNRLPRRRECAPSMLAPSVQWPRARWRSGVSARSGGGPRRRGVQSRVGFRAGPGLDLLEVVTVVVGRKGVRPIAGRLSTPRRSDGEQKALVRHSLAGFRGRESVNVGRSALQNTRFDSAHLRSTPWPVPLTRCAPPGMHRIPTGRRRSASRLRHADIRLRFHNRVGSRCRASSRIAGARTAQPYTSEGKLLPGGA